MFRFPDLYTSFCIVQSEYQAVGQSLLGEIANCDFQRISSLMLVFINGIIIIILALANAGGGIDSSNVKKKRFICTMKQRSVGSDWTSRDDLIDQVG